jgi:hypothetical protein
MSNVRPRNKNRNFTMQRLIALGRFAFAVAVGFASSIANAQDFVAYYQIGGDKVPWVSWDTYVVDAASLVADGTYIRYRSFRITAHGSDPAQELKADCKTRRRGLAAESSMYATYDGALTGEEVKAACALAEAKGIVRK